MRRPSGDPQPQPPATGRVGDVAQVPESRLGEPSPTDTGSDAPAPAATSRVRRVAGFAAL
ncbi:MAG: hypothetical protein QOF69_2768, partial [Solirubrobacteraceae bacterium]|nr:hypothetical protein [Solirubrobacteraceae bacterium]